MAPYKDEPSTLLMKTDQDKNPSDIETATEDETTSLLTGYGSVANKDGVQTPFNASEDFPLDGEENAANNRRKALKRWGWIGVGALLYVVGVMAYNGTQSNNNSIALANQEVVSDVELLGSSKKSKKEKEEKEKEEKREKEAEKKLEKAKKEEEKKIKEAEKKAEKEKKEAEKKLKEKEKKMEKERKEEEKKKTKFEPVTYPSCPSGVEMTYIKEALPFDMHEMAAQASDCHLASIHNLEEQEKYSKAGLFKVSYGPEIGMSFAAGKPLTKTFWLGGRFGVDMDAWEWTDNSTWDFGPNSTAVEGCLASTFSFLEVAMPVVAPEDHWAVVDCNTPLPAIYKCCIPTPSPSAYPSETPTESPTEYPTESPTEFPTEYPTDPPTLEPSTPPVASEESPEGDGDAEEPAEEEPTEEEVDAPKKKHKKEEEPDSEEPVEDESKGKKNKDEEGEAAEEESEKDEEAEAPGNAADADTADAVPTEVDTKKKEKKDDISAVDDSKKDKEKHEDLATDAAAEPAAEVPAEDDTTEEENQDDTSAEDATKKDKKKHEEVTVELEGVPDTGDDADNAAADDAAAADEDAAAAGNVPAVDAQDAVVEPAI